MQYNSFVGRIPSCVTSLRGLRQLNLSKNRLRFGISPMLVFSDKLLALDLIKISYLTLPSKMDETTGKSGLLVLDPSHNQFSDDIPLKITDLKNLQPLSLSQFTYWRVSWEHWEVNVSESHRSLILLFIWFRSFELRRVFPAPCIDTQQQLSF